MRNDKNANEQSAKQMAFRVDALVRAKLDHATDRSAVHRLEDELDSYRDRYRQAGVPHGDTDEGMVKWYFEKLEHRS